MVLISEEIIPEAQVLGLPWRTEDGRSNLPRVAIIITNFNMPERADALVEYIQEFCYWPNDIYLVDNGSDIMPPAKHTTVRLSANLQTVGGWSAGFEAADRAEARRGFKYFAYWVMITSAEFPKQPLYADVLTELVEVMLANDDIVGIHPGLDRYSTTHWKHLYAREASDGLWACRQTWMIDNIAALWRADWFNSIGRFDRRLEYGWGVDLETCYLARKQGKSLWVHDGVLIHKETDIGYTLGRMGMSAEDRRRRAADNMNKVLTRKYGPDWRKMMENDYVEPEWR